MAMLGYRFRIYPSKTVQQKLDEQLGFCRWLYNRLLEKLNKARDDYRKLKSRDTQTLIVKLRRESSSLKNVYSKVLRMVNNQLWMNMVGRLRYKGGRRFKTLNFNQSGFKIDSESMDDLYGDYISACRMRNRGLGSGRPSEPVERRLPFHITSYEVATRQVSSMKQKALSFTVG